MATAALVAAALAGLLVACNGVGAGEAPAGAQAGAGAAGRAGSAEVVRLIERQLARIAARADTIDRIFQPIPLLRPSQENSLRQLEPQHMARARALGVAPGLARAARDSLVAAGRLVRLADSTELWIVRELDYSDPYLTPDAVALLRELATRFQARLAALDIPLYRLEVTSVLRTAAHQAALRRVNPNAARGVSTHEFGTTFDVAYSGFAAPAEPITDVRVPEVPAVEPLLASMAAALAETVAARRSRELMAILGQVLLELQAEGAVLVTLERLQPVYHLTVARPLAGRG